MVGHIVVSLNFVIVHLLVLVIAMATKPDVLGIRKVVEIHIIEFLLLVVNF